MDGTSTCKATFAGGCFWCVVAPFQDLPGVLSVVSGYAGGQEEHPTYEQVSSGATGHVEAVQVTYDPDIVSYEELLDVYWRQIDPFDEGGQFNDRGFQYTTAIFYQTKDERASAERTKQEVEERFEKKVTTRITPFTSFFPAEDYRQDYHEKHPLRYTFYRSASGRDAFIKRTWSAQPSLLGEQFVKPSPQELKEHLTPEQYHVTQEGGTERAFANEYHDHKEPGIYVDVVSGEPLFASIHKFDSKTGWPSFTQPISEDAVVEKKDFKLIIPRTEVRSRLGDSHLGHVFSDGPQPQGKRYCMNSAALRFIHKDDLVKEGYGNLSYLFED